MSCQAGQGEGGDNIHVTQTPTVTLTTLVTLPNSVTETEKNVFKSNLPDSIQVSVITGTFCFYQRP